MSTIREQNTKTDTGTTEDFFAFEPEYTLEVQLTDSDRHGQADTLQAALADEPTLLMGFCEKFDAEADAIPPSTMPRDDLWSGAPAPVFSAPSGFRLRITAVWVDHKGDFRRETYTYDLTALRAGIHLYLRKKVRAISPALAELAHLNKKTAFFDIPPILTYTAPAVRCKNTLSRAFARALFTDENGMKTTLDQCFENQQRWQEYSEACETITARHNGFADEQDAAPPAFFADTERALFEETLLRQPVTQLDFTVTARATLHFDQDAAMALYRKAERSDLKAPPFPYRQTRSLYKTLTALASDCAAGVIPSDAHRAALKKSIAECIQAKTDEKLKNTSVGALSEYGLVRRLDYLRSAGIRTMQDLARTPDGTIQAIKGIGPATCAKIRQATGEYIAAVRKSVTLRFTPERCKPEELNVLHCTYGVTRYEVLHKELQALWGEQQADLTLFCKYTRKASTRMRWMVQSDRQRKIIKAEAARAKAYAESPTCHRLRNAVTDLADISKADETEIWADFHRNEALYSDLIRALRQCSR